MMLGIVAMVQAAKRGPHEVWWAVIKNVRAIGKV
jgi:hypothetical protein